ncbi:Sec1-binding region of Mso1 domain containing protein [Rhypophila sp. PSN 637]
MSSWYSNLLTNASTNITKLQRTYFGGETDGDTEDDTHVCRVLRNYYTEKGQPFPGWLPPDPKAPPPVQPVYASSNQVGRGYGGLQHGAGPAGGSTSKLNSLWDKSGSNNNDTAGGAASLRTGGRGAGPGAQQRSPFANRLGRDQGGLGVQSRPLPSQRAGSYQQTSGAGYGRNDGVATAAPTSSAASVSSGSSAQEKLKQRLWGGARTTSPAGGGPFNPPAPQQQSSSRFGGGGGGGNYEDRFAPGGMYDAGNDTPPVMSANAPWAGGGGYDYSGGYGGGGGGRSGEGRTAGGLPSNPRRPGGLPSGPRPNR